MVGRGRPCRVYISYDMVSIDRTTVCQAVPHQHEYARVAVRRIKFIRLISYSLSIKCRSESGDFAEISG